MATIYEAVVLRCVPQLHTSALAVRYAEPADLLGERGKRRAMCAQGVVHKLDQLLDEKWFVLAQGCNPIPREGPRQGLLE